MDLPVSILDDIPDQPKYTVNLPHAFLNYLLTDGYQFDQGTLVLKLTSPFEESYYCCMEEFTRDRETIDIPATVNRVLNVVPGMYVHVERVCLPMTPDKIILQGHRESFGEIDVHVARGQLEQLLLRVRVINQGMTYFLNGPNGPEPFTVVAIQRDERGVLPAQPVESAYGMTINSDFQPLDINVDFMETLEGVEIKAREEALAEQLALEQEKIEEAQRIAREGRAVGGTRIDRQAWLDRLKQLEQQGKVP